MNLKGMRSATGSWGSRGGGGGSMVAGSPGVGGMSNSSSSSGASWRSGTPSPPLSEEGVPTRSSPCPATSHPSHNQPHYPYNASGSSSSSTPGSSTLDEGIVPDYIEEQHPRKKVSNLFPMFVHLLLIQTGRGRRDSAAYTFVNISLVAQKIWMC